MAGIITNLFERGPEFFSGDYEGNPAHERQDVLNRAYDRAHTILSAALGEASRESLGVKPMTLDQYQQPEPLPSAVERQNLILSEEITAETHTMAGSSAEPAHEEVQLSSRVPSPTLTVVHDAERLELIDAAQAALEAALNRN